VDNAVRGLSDDQIVAVYGGKILNWRQLGGRDAPIAVLNSHPDRSSSELFTQYFKMSYGDMKPHRTLGDNRERIKAIVENPNAVIYMSVGEAERNALAGVPIKLLPVGGAAATSKNIRSGNFPISRALTLVTKDVPQGLAK
jgi:phosphate transport system substrate-binding protein